LGRRKKRNKREQPRPTASQRAEVKRIRSLIRDLGKKRGAESEDRVEEALGFIALSGFLRFERSERWDERDRKGIDFEIWGLPPNKCHFTIDVKSSRRNAEDVAERTKEKNRKHHHPLLVQPGDHLETIMIRILEIFKKEIKRR